MDLIVNYPMDKYSSEDYQDECGWGVKLTPKKGRVMNDQVTEQMVEAQEELAAETYLSRDTTEDKNTEVHVQTAEEIGDETKPVE